MVEIRPTRRLDIPVVSAGLREQDRAECLAAGWGPRDALEYSVDVSEWARTAVLDGRPIAVFGVSRQGRIGVPWFLGTDDVPRQRRVLMRLAPKYIRAMLADFPHLVNRVHAENRLAVAWLRHMGFTLHEPAPVEPTGELFHLFELRRDANR